jgi:hypothetical protein
MLARCRRLVCRCAFAAAACLPAIMSSLPPRTGAAWPVAVACLRQHVTLAAGALNVHTGHKQHQQSTSHRAAVLRSASTASPVSRDLEGSSTPSLIRSGRLLQSYDLSGCGVRRPSIAEEARAPPLAPFCRLPRAPSRRCATRKCGSAPPFPLRSTAMAAYIWMGQDWEGRN